MKIYKLKKYKNTENLNEIICININIMHKTI